MEHVYANDPLVFVTISDVYSSSVVAQDWIELGEVLNLVHKAFNLVLVHWSFCAGVI